MKNTILAQGGLPQEPRQREARTSQADVSPGMLVVLSSGQFIKHATIGQGGDFAIAKENSLAQDKVSTVYANGDTVFAYDPQPNVLFNVRVAASQNITAVGTPLTSNGAGLLKICATNGTEEVLFYADEVINVGAGGAGTLVRVRVAARGFAGV